MDRFDAYALLSTELEIWRRIPFAGLTELVDLPPSIKSAAVGSEVGELAVLVRWADERRRTIRIKAILYGPSCWTLERFEEAVIVRP